MGVCMYVCMCVELGSACQVLGRTQALSMVAAYIYRIYIGHRRGEEWPVNHGSRDRTSEVMLGDETVEHVCSMSSAARHGRSTGFEIEACGRRWS